MKIRFLGLLVAFVFFSLPALGDVAPARDNLPNGCQRFTMCSAEADVIASCDNGTDNIVANISGYHQLGFDASTSTATAFTCMPRLGSAYSATKASDLLESPITETSYGGASASGTFNRIWIECETAITGGVVTITMDACP